jgi:MFS family permease
VLALFLLLKRHAACAFLRLARAWYNSEIQRARSYNDMPDLQSLRDGLEFMKGNILVLTVTRVLGMFCRSMVFPYASLYILALGGEPAQIGLINSLKPLAGLIMFPIAGYIADRAGRVKLIALGGYLSGSVLLLYVLAPSWEVVAFAGLLQGFVVFQFPPTSAIIADSLSPQNRGKGIATMNTISGALAMFSPYLAGAILDVHGEKAGMRLLYGVMMAVYLVNATINLRFLEETSACSKERLNLSSLPRAFKNAYGGIPTMLRQLPRSLRALAAIIVLGFTSNAVASSFWVVYAKEHIGLASKEWGLILLIETLLRNLLNIPSGMVVDRYGRTRFVLASLLLSLVSIPLFVFSSSLIQVLLVRSVVAVANAFFTPACSALMADAVPRDMRGRVMAAVGRGAVMLGAASGGTGGPGMGFLITLPVMLGSLAGGYLYGHNPTFPWFFVLSATAISLLLSALFLRDPQQAEI